MMTPTADIQLSNAGTDCASAVDGRMGALAKATAARALSAIRALRGPAASTDGASDEALVARVAQGDRRAMQLLFVRHQQKVYRFVLRMVANSATAEDIMSDVFIELWRQAASFEGRARLSTWLLAIARNKALSAMRRRLDQPLEEAMAIPDDALPADETLDANRRSAVLRRCLAQLSPVHREIVDLVYYHDKSVEEVSAILGVPAATVKTRMFYARKRLAELLRAAGVEMARC
jgi:RNA polymerase sigma-70 factor (ECF subfamily)